MRGLAPYFSSRGSLPSGLGHGAGQPPDWTAYGPLLIHMSPDMLSRQSDAAFECAHDRMVVTM